MPSNHSLLIVEDDEEWCAIYADMATREGVGTVKTATNLAGAVELVDQIRFSFAIIDIGLDTAEDYNADGMKVLQRIRSLGDETSLIVVTGRSGVDVLPLTRDAIMKYQVLDIVGKMKVVPQDIREAIHRGVEAFTVSVADHFERRCAQGLNLLHHLISNGPSKFDGTSQSGIPEGLARRLLAEWLPILPEKRPSQLDGSSPPGLTTPSAGAGRSGSPLLLPWPVWPNWTKRSIRLARPVSCSADIPLASCWNRSAGTTGAGPSSRLRVRAGTASSSVKAHQNE